MSNTKNGIYLSAMKKNPKPNAPKYKIKTIRGLLKVVTQENKKGFLKDFANFLDMALPLKEIARNAGASEKEINGIEFTWFDD